MTYEWVLILLASLTAWCIGYTMRSGRIVQKNNLPRDYLVGLNFVLNEEPDKAVDIFVKMLEVDSETVETHLAVAKLYRRRGEVDRAIRIHQNLIARPHLEKIYKEQSLFELGQDYLRAGVLDRAERVFTDLIETKNFSNRALKSLLDIYQQEKAWDKAIVTAKKMQSITSENVQPIIAHYYCELAENAYVKKNIDKSERYLKNALEEDRDCVRASLIYGQIEMEKRDYKAALKNFKRIKNQDITYLSAAIEPIAACYEALHQEEELVAYLKEILQEFPKMPVVLILSERIRKWKGDKTAANFVADYVRKFPSLAGLHQFVSLYISSAEGRAKDDLIILHGLTKKLLAEKPDYKCTSCGYSGHTLLWQCPGCKLWNTVKPIFCFEYSTTQY